MNHLYIASFASAWDDTVTTHTTELCRTRHDAVQALWRAIIDAKYHANSVLTFWNYIFSADGLGYEPEYVYNELLDNMSEHDRVDCGIIRRLFTREMTRDIEDTMARMPASRDLDERARFLELCRQFDERYEPHLRAVVLTEEELVHVMNRFSESANVATIYFTMEIKALAMPQ